MTKKTSSLLDKMLKPHAQGLSNESYANILNQGIQLQRNGHFDLAEQQYLTLLQHRPNDHQVLSLLSTLCLHLGRFDECLDYAGRSLAKHPMQPDICNVVGDAHYYQQHYEDAFKAYSLSLRLRPDDAKTLYDAANVLKPLGRNEEAKSLYERAIALNPEYAEAHHNLGVIYRGYRQSQEALACFNRAIELNPTYAEAYVNCGIVLSDMGKYDFALAHFAYALEVQPDHTNALNGQGTVLHNIKQFDAALESYNQAIASNPYFVDAYINRGNTLTALGRHEEALENYAEALRLTPQNPRVFNNLGNLYLDQGNHAEALAQYNRALEVDATNPTALWNKALIKIVQGEYEEGWRLYEHGWEAEGPPRGHRRQCRQPLWLGDEPIAGKRILLTAEQGFGDAIQFSRYALQVAEMGATVILEAPKPLMGLMQTLGEQFTVIERGSEYDDYDLYTPYMSLPLAFGTRVDTVPVPMPYLKAEAARQAKFGLGGHERLRVGLVWSGSLTHARDHRRSIPLAMLQSWMSLPVEFHSLQKEIRPQDMEVLNELPVQQHQDQLESFSDTAALIEAMDLVISVDTSVAHLAGALNKPVWVLLPKVPDYRWLLERSDTPWYPTARLFRQPAVGDWESVMTAVLDALKKHAT